jgi:H+/gluconate symporter-like permease
LRYALISLGLANAITLVWAAFYVAQKFYGPHPVEVLMMIGLAANAGCLIWAGGVGVGSKVGRAGRLFGLWLDAKEAELKKKAGTEAPTQS